MANLAKDLSEIIAYFQSIQSKSKTLKSFVHGPSERIISQSRSELEYPCLWLETPSLHLKDNGGQGLFGDQVGAFIIIKNAPTDVEQSQDDCLAETQRIALQVIARIRRDTREMNFRIDLNASVLEPISTLFVDNEYGWRCEFKITDFAHICYDDTQWNE